MNPFRFLDLPAELRESIYEFSFSSRRADDFNTPAISRTCRLLRKEALPLFYKTQRFALNLLTEDAVQSSKLWIRNLSNRGTTNDHFQPLLLIRRWSLLLHIDCYAVLPGNSEYHPTSALRYMGLNIDLDARYPGGRVQEVRSPTIHAWIHSIHNRYYMNRLQTPLSRAKIEESDAKAVGFGGILEDVGHGIESLWEKRRDGTLEAEDYAGMVGLIEYLRPFLTIHPQRDMGSRELLRPIIELHRLDGIASNFMEAI
jgi:hypothetical protein